MNRNASIMIVVLLMMLLALAGCRTARSSVQSSIKEDFSSSHVSDNSVGTMRKSTSDSTVLSLASSESQNVTVHFEEWEYYLSSQDTVIKSSEESKPPNNGGSIKAYRKGTLTLNAGKETKQNEGNVTQTEESAVAKSTSSVKEDTNVTSNATEKNSKGKSSLWFIVAVMCAMVFVGFGVYLAKKLL